jgi:hypothetical protein
MGLVMGGAQLQPTRAGEQATLALSALYCCWPVALTAPKAHVHGAQISPTGICVHWSFEVHAVS